MFFVNYFYMFSYFRVVFFIIFIEDLGRIFIGLVWVLGLCLY